MPPYSQTQSAEAIVIRAVKRAQEQKSRTTVLARTRHALPTVHDELFALKVVHFDPSHHSMATVTVTATHDLTTRLKTSVTITMFSSIHQHWLAHLQEQRSRHDYAKQKAKSKTVATVEEQRTSEDIHLHVWL